MMRIFQTRLETIPAGQQQVWSGLGFNSNERARLEGRKHFNEPWKQRAKLLNSIAVRHENRDSYW